MMCSPVLGIQNFLNSGLREEGSVERQLFNFYAICQNKVEGTVKIMSGFIYPFGKVN